MKMEELNEFYEEFEGESILEYFEGEENDSHMLNETDSFYFYDDGQETGSIKMADFIHMS